MFNPVISICIPYYMDSDSLYTTLLSIVQQRYPHFECIVSDESPNKDAKYMIEHFNDSRIIYIRQQSHLGVPKHWNNVLQHASGNIITLLHQDDFYTYSDSLYLISKEFSNNSTDIVVCGFRIFKDGKQCGDITHREDELHSFCKSFPQRTLVINRIGHPSVVFFRRRLLNICYNERLKYFVDTEYYSRLFVAGRHCAYIPHPLVAVGYSSRSLSSSCVSDMPSVVQECCNCLRMLHTHVLPAGLALARLLASHTRHCLRGDLTGIFRALRNCADCKTLIVAALSIVFFELHMVYRWAYRMALRHPW